MTWFKEYQLFLFDFDGLLVDTEKLHYQAYINTCAHRGFNLNWTFSRYSLAAHHKATALRDQIYEELPELHLQEPDWKVIYAEKQACLLNILSNNPIPIMPGVEVLLDNLQQSHKQRCVVTHSPRHVIEIIRNKNPILNSIPHWITREDYIHPKPSPECFQYAIDKFGKSGDRIIGFEDSPRGLNALLQTKSQAVLICPPESDYISQMIQNNPSVKYFPNFNSIDSTILG